MSGAYLLSIIERGICYNSFQMDKELLDRFTALEKKIDSIYRSVEVTKKIFIWTIVITAATVILPLIGLAFVIPQYLNALTTGLKF